MLAGDGRLGGAVRCGVEGGVGAWRGGRKEEKGRWKADVDGGGGEGGG